MSFICPSALLLQVCYTLSVDCTIGFRVLPFAFFRKIGFLSLFLIWGYAEMLNFDLKNTLGSFNNGKGDIGVIRV